LVIKFGGIFVYITPLLWNSRVNHSHRLTSYKFEKWWLLREDFKDLAIKFWQEPTKSKTAINRWQEKIRTFRKTSKDEVGT
jgi:hypothetical protein